MYSKEPKIHDPDSSLAVFSPGSSHPASVLYDALEHFDQKSPKADESIRSIRPDLANAVDTCIEAAGHEIESHWQKRLLKVGPPSTNASRARVLADEGRPLNSDEHSWTSIIPANSLLWDKRSKFSMLYGTTKSAYQSPTPSESPLLSLAPLRS